MNSVTPAWTRIAKDNTCRNHGNESTQLLPAAAAGTDRRVSKASDMEM